MSHVNKDKIFSIPNGERLKAIAIYVTLSTVAFAVVYGWCNKEAALSPTLYKMFTQWELTIPLIPWMIYPYISLNLLFVVAAFVLKDVSSVKAFCLSLIVGAFVAGIFFYFLPGELGFVRQTVPGYEHFFDFMFSIDQPHNLYPSLHVTYSTLAIFAMIEQTINKIFHVFLIFWLTMITLSVVFVHQHHIFDIVTGFILALILYKTVYEKVHNLKFQTKVQIKTQEKRI